MIRKTVFVIILSICSINLFAQDSAIPDSIICYAADYNAGTQLLLTLNSGAKIEATAQIDVTYIDFPEEAKPAFEAAVSIWESYINTSKTIRIKATWASLAGGSLASSGATRIFRNFKNAPLTDVWYVVPLAEAISGEELNSGDYDINVNVNKNINWSYNTQGTPINNKYDLSTIVLHEIAHGLGYSSTMKPSGNSQAQWGQSGYGMIYDFFLQKPDKVLFTNSTVYGNPSATLLSAITSGSVYFKVNNPGLAKDLPKIYSPNPYEDGGSLSHVDESYYPAGSENSLMTPNIAAAEIIHTPGQVILSILNQIGWGVNNLQNNVITATEPVLPEIMIYPNPVSNQVTLLVPSHLRSSNSKISLLDNWGQVLEQAAFDSTLEPNKTIDISHYVSDIYFIRLENEFGIFVRRIIKN